MCALWVRTYSDFFLIFGPPSVGGFSGTCWFEGHETSHTRPPRRDAHFGLLDTQEKPHLSPRQMMAVLDCEQSILAVPLVEVDN